MDWLQFTSSVISSITSMIGGLAWPAVVAFLLVMLRPQLGSLAKRLSELTLPGGAKASFTNELNLAQSETIHLTAKAAGSSTVSGNLSVGEKSEIDSPRRKIQKNFDSVHDFMAQHLVDIPFEHRKSPADFVFYELKDRVGGKEVHELFERLRSMLLSVSLVNDGMISELDAKKYEDICIVFKGLFMTAIEKWKLEKGVGASVDKSGA